MGIANKYVCESRFTQVGKMICRGCFCDLRQEKLYLVIEYCDFRARGNESDFDVVMCQRCSLSDKAWKIYENEKSKEKKEMSLQLLKLKNTIIQIVEKSSSVEIEEFSDGFQIWCQKSKIHAAYNNTSGSSMSSAENPRP